MVRKALSFHSFSSASLTSIGLVNAHTLSTGHPLPYSIGTGPIKGAYTYAKEISRGKDTLSGHWELTGVPVDFDWGYFPDVPHCFPKDIVDGLITGGNLPGVLGEKHASGTEIIKELGCEHMRTGKPIIYTSADSVLQIAAHEETFGLERLYTLCEKHLIGKTLSYCPCHCPSFCGNGTGELYPDRQSS